MHVLHEVKHSFFIVCTQLTHGWFFILRIFTIEQVKNDYELLLIFGVKGNEERHRTFTIEQVKIIMNKIRIGESMRSSLVSIENLVIN